MEKEILLSDLVKSDYSELTTDEQGQIRGGFGSVSATKGDSINVQNNCICWGNNCVCYNSGCQGAANNCSCGGNNCSCNIIGPTTQPSSGIPGGLVAV